MRILIGTFEIARQIDDLAAGFRALGHEVTTVVCGRNPQHPDLAYDIEFDMMEAGRQTQHLLSDPLGTFANPPEHLSRVRQLIDAHDLFVFQFGSSLLPHNLDYRLIRQAGKRLIALFVGSDIFEWSSAQPVCTHYGYDVAEMYFHPPYDDLETRLRNLREAERWADAVCWVPHFSGLAIRPAHNVYLAMRMDTFREHVPRREKPTLVHAPTRRGFKGTQEFLDALDRLKEEGYAFDLRLLEGVPHRAVVEALRDADICLDELNAPYYGALTLEGMASGCAVVAGSHPEYAPYHAQAPVWNATKGTAYERVKALLDSPDERIARAQEGRAYVEAHHDHVNVARYLLGLLEPGATPHYWPTYFARQYALPEGKTVTPRLKTLTTQIATRFGLPDGVTLAHLDARGLADAGAAVAAQPVVSWSRPDSALRDAFWGWSPALSDGETQPDPVGELSVLVARAIELVALGRADAVSELFTQAVTLVQSHAELQQSPRALALLGRLALDSGQADTARALWKQAQVLEPTDDLKLALKALG